jgi:rubredoxin
MKLLYSEYNGRLMANINKCPTCGGRMLQFKKKHIKQNYTWAYSIECPLCSLFKKDYD